MSLHTDLSTFQVIDSEPAMGGATLTSVAISKSGKYYATADEKGNIFVCQTNSKELVRTYFLEGSVHILQFTHIRSKTMLIAATKRGYIKAWQLNAQSNLIRWQKRYPLCVNAVALNAQKDRLAVSVGLQVHLYSDPWDSSVLATPLKTWAPATPSAGGETFYKYPLAIGLHFTQGNDLLISYLAGHCLVRTREPYNVVSRVPSQLPSRIAHVSMSPNGQYAVSTNLNNGFDVFDVQNGEFTETHDYLSTTAATISCENIHTIQSSFLSERFLVTGHRDPLVCIFEFKGDAFGDPLMISVPDAEPGYGIQQLATGVYKRKPFIIALSGKNSDSQHHFIGAHPFREEHKMILAPGGLKKREASNGCQRLILMMSLTSILVGLMMLGVVFTGARGFL